MMEYQKIINLLDNTPNQSSKFRIKNWVEINDDSRGTYNTNSQCKFKNSMLKSNLYDFRDAYIIVKGTITVSNTATAATSANNRDKKVISKNWTPFTDCLSEINNTQVDDVKDINVVIPMQNAAIIILKHQEVYDNTIQMNQL